MVIKETMSSRSNSRSGSGSDASRQGAGEDLDIDHHPAIEQAPDLLAETGLQTRIDPKVASALMLKMIITQILARMIRSRRLMEV